MNKVSYSGYRFPPEIIQQTIWLYLRFTLSLRDVEDLLAERGVAVSYETVRRWVNHFGPMIAADLRKRRLRPHTSWHLDEVYLKIDGRMVYLWRAVDAEGEVLDESIRISGVFMLPRAERPQPHYRWRDRDTIPRKESGACHRARGFGSAAAGARRASSTASADVWRSAC